MKKETLFILVKKQEKKEGKILVEFDKTQHCEICDGVGSYWVGGNDSICRPCIIGLAKLLKNN